MSIAIHDLSNLKSKTKPYKVNGRIKPLDSNAPLLTFDLMRLAHAVKKAECAVSLNRNAIRLAGIGFLLENHYLFTDKGGNFRLVDDAKPLNAEFYRSALAGRTAQGLVVLAMEDKGYGLLEHFKTHCDNARPSVSTVITKFIGRGKKRREIKVQCRTPDFVFAKSEPSGRSRPLALVESKGSFVAQGHASDLNGSLNDALAQLGDWGSKFRRPIAENYAMAAFVRESSDDHPEQSFLAYVDPPAKANPDASRTRPAGVLRGNYASWLRGMGYFDCAERIYPPADGERRDEVGREFNVTTIGGIEYAYSISAHLQNEYRLISALNLDVLRRLAAASRKGDDEAWVSLEEMRLPPRIRLDSGTKLPTSEAVGEAAAWSLLGDGSLFGFVARSNLRPDSDRSVSLRF